jgi:hypothetical protein
MPHTSTPSDVLVSVAVCGNAHSNPTMFENLSWQVFRDLELSQHTAQAQKGGPAYIFASLDGGRCDEHVQSVSCLAYDIDGKLTFSEVSRAVAASGLEAVTYTTFNHLKTRTTVGAKSYRTWANINGYADPPTNESMAAFCAAHRKYDHLSNIRITDDGVIVRVRQYDREFDAFVVEHDGEHKARVIIPLAQAIPLKVVGKDGYKAIYHAIGERLFGTNYDVACCNPARLNYAPSCRAGSVDHVIEHHRGLFLEWEPDYEKAREVILKQREDAARRCADWAGTPPCALADLHHVLKAIPSDLPRPDWFKALAAIFHETLGSDEGRALAHSWSERDYSEYDAEEVDAIWDGFDPDHQRPASMGTLVRLARGHDATFDSRFLTILRSAREFSGDMDG